MARRYAPALTKAAFKKVKPHGTYSTYLDFLAKRRPGWDRSRAGVAQTYKPPAPKPQPKPQTNYQTLIDSMGRLETPAQIEARANRMAQTQQTYQQKLIDAEYAEAQGDAKRQMLALQEAGRAAASMNAELMGRVGASYDSAGQSMRALGGSLGAAMSGATAADVAAANRSLGAVGAPNVQVGGPAGSTSIAGADQAAVESYRGGELAARQLGSTSIAQQFGMSNLIGAQNLRATQEASAAFVGVSREAARAKASAIKALAAGRPQAAMQFLQQLQAAQRQQIALTQGLLGAKQASETQDLQNTMAKEKFKIDKSQVDAAKSQMNGFVTYVDGTQPVDSKGNKIPVSKLLTPGDKAALAASRAQTALAKQKAKIEWSQVDPTKSMAKGWVVNLQGKYILDDKGNKIPAKKLLVGTKSKSGRSLTPGQAVDLMRHAQENAETMFYGYTKDPKTGKRVPATQGGDFDPNNPDTWGTTGAMDYQAAYRRLVMSQVPPATARAILDEYYVPGNRGRPIFTDAQTKKARKKFGGKGLSNAIRQIKEALAAGNESLAMRLRAEILSGELTTGPLAP